MAIFTKTITLENANTVEHIFLNNGIWKPLNADNATVLQASKDKVLFNKVISLIEQATESVCLQSFLIQDTVIIDALIKATERGVRVFITSAAEARLKGTIDEEIDFRKDNYIKMLNEKFKYRFIHRSAKNMHAKFIVIDGKTQPKGIIFTNNFTENGFFKNPELGIVLTGEQATELYKVFVFYFWEKTTDEQTADNEFDTVKNAQKFISPNLNNVLLSSDKTLINSVLSAVGQAKKDIVFSTFSLSKDFEICRAIAKKQQQGIAISLFTRLNNKQLNDQFKDFLINKSDIFLHPVTHAKFILIDNTEGYVFTANFNQSDFETDFNVGIKLLPEQVKELIKIIDNWKIQLPYKWVKKGKISNLSEYSVYENDNFISKKIDLLKKDKEELQINTVNDLTHFFKKERCFVDNKFQRQELVLNVGVQDFRGNLEDTSKYSIKELGIIKLVTEFEQIKIKEKQEYSIKEKRQFLLLSKNETIETLLTHIEENSEVVANKLPIFTY